MHLDTRSMEKIGEVSVDAGIIMIGDPCYTLPDDASHRTDAAKEWDTFCDVLFESESRRKGVEPFGSGIGLVVSSGYGDGSYPVYVRYEDGIPAQVVIDFMGEC
jgi:hypothetical protein